jgi:hypothetical protein
MVFPQVIKFAESIVQKRITALSENIPVMYNTFQHKNNKNYHKMYWRKLLYVCVYSMFQNSELFMKYHATYYETNFCNQYHLYT